MLQRRHRFVSDALAASTPLAPLKLARPADENKSDVVGAAPFAEPAAVVCCCCPLFGEDDDVDEEVKLSWEKLTAMC